MSSEVWDEITYPFPNFNGATVEVWEGINNFIPYFGCNCLSMMGLKLNHVSKGATADDEYSVEYILVTHVTHFGTEIEVSRKNYACQYPLLLMPWLLLSPGHQQQWHWLCRINIHEPLSSTKRILKLRGPHEHILCMFFESKWLKMSNVK